MARYLLDTTVLIDVSKQIEPVSAWLGDLLRGPDEVGVCSVTVAEFFSGLRPEERARWTRFVAETRFWEADAAAAVQAGVYRFAFARRGRVISAPDALVAAIAIAAGAILVTDNAKHYPMPELTVLRPPG